MHSMRMIPGENGMRTDSVEMREFSCPCSDCATGGQCRIISQNRSCWKICPLVLKPVQNNLINPLPVNIPLADIREENDDPWDFWDQ